VHIIKLEVCYHCVTSIKPCYNCPRHWILIGLF